MTQQTVSEKLGTQSPIKIVKRMQIDIPSKNFDVIDYDKFATWLRNNPNAGKHTYHKKNLIEEMIGCHSDNTKFCGKCIKDMEQRLFDVFENRYRNAGHYGRAISNTQDVLRFMYRVVGELENVENGQMFLYQKWNECIVYDIYHEPIIVQDTPVYRKDTTYQVYVNDVPQYEYADQGYWMFNVNPSAKGLNTPKVLQVNP